MAGRVSLLDPLDAVNDAAGREIWASDEIDQLVRADVGLGVDVLEQSASQILFGRPLRLALGDDQGANLGLEGTGQLRVDAG